MLKQVVRGLDEVPERIAKAFQDRERVIGGQRLVLSEIVELLRGILSSERTFICIDALDECQERHRAELLNSLNEILKGSPGARIFITGRPYVRDEVERRLTGRVVTRSIAPTEGDIARLSRAKLNKDPIPDAMNESLEEEIIQNILETVSEM